MAYSYAEDGSRKSDSEDELEATETYYHILVKDSQGSLQYLYLGTLSTQLYYDPLVAVNPENPFINYSGIFVLNATGGSTHGDDLWRIRPYITPNVTASVVGSPPQQYDIYMNIPLDQQQYQKFYFRDENNQPVPDPISKQGEYLSICFEDNATNGDNGPQLFWLPGSTGSQPIKGSEMQRSASSMAVFQLKKIPDDFHLPPPVPALPVVKDDQQHQPPGHASLCQIY